MLKQVIINLIKNASEAMKDRDKKVLSIRTSQRGLELRIQQTDTGRGMDQETLGQLFSPFFTTKVGGAGLGLAVSRKLIREHGGEIWADSTTGVGSTFYISLPMETSSQSEKEGA